jgi:hypothetical protein
VYPPAQVADGSLADPAAIDVENELGPALGEHNTGIDRAQDNDPAVSAALDEVVDDPALQLEWGDLYQKDADRQRQKHQLMHPAGRQHIAEDAARQLVGRNGPELADPSCEAHRSEIRRSWRAGE